MNNLEARTGPLERIFPKDHFYRLISRSQAAEGADRTNSSRRGISDCSGTIPRISTFLASTSNAVLNFCDGNYLQRRALIVMLEDVCNVIYNEITTKHGKPTWIGRSICIITNLHVLRDNRSRAYRYGFT